MQIEIDFEFKKKKKKNEFMYDIYDNFLEKLNTVSRIFLKQT